MQVGQTAHALILMIVMANGGLISSSGSLNVAIAASYHSIPLVICAGLYTLSPSYPYIPENLNAFANPESTHAFKNCKYFVQKRAHCVDCESVNLISPQFDFIPPNFLALYITNVGPHPPSYIKKLLVESYGQCQQE